ncbi:hypothetical protein [Polaribacter marinivivus]|uniref:hypothetical protein n=1 Tax=Polaribacter marinivivus TaxID=1524260 RepID=UPI003D348F2F
MYKTIQKYEEFTKDSIKQVTTNVKKDSTTTKDKKEKLTPEKLDSIKQELNDKMDKSFIPIPKKAKEKLMEELDKELKDSTNLKKINDNSGKDINLEFGGDTRLDKFVSYVDKNPEAEIDIALDSLGYEKNFSNRFLYTRAKTVHSFTKSKETREQYFNQLLSYGSIALFIFLPIFTLFLKFYYIRRKFTYIDHLVFVFHVQTVFFMLFAFHFIFLIFHLEPKLWIFIILFLLYLYLAMKKFYQQGYIKTFFKFILLNISFGFIGIFGVAILFVISFAIF